MKKKFQEAKIFASDIAKNWIKTNDVIDEGFSNAKFSDNVVVLVQGYARSVKPITWHLRKPLEDEGFNVFVFNPGSSVNKRIEDLSKELSIFIERVCCEAEVTHVSLIAHSMGGLIALYYSEKLDGYKRIKKIITAGTPFHGTRVAYLGMHTRAGRQIVPKSKFLQALLKDLNYANKIVSVRTCRDQAIRPQSSSILEGAKNIEVSSVGHVALIRSDDFFDIIKKELSLA